MFSLLILFCFRGRTGTFIALVIAKYSQISTISQLVDIIVDMRANRDGLLELPAQFQYVVRLLGLKT
jgi:hypothetical protein